MLLNNLAVPSDFLKTFAHVTGLAAHNAVVYDTSLFSAGRKQKGNGKLIFPK